MDSKELPARPNLEQYKKQAKDLVRVFKDVTQAPDGKLHLAFKAFSNSSRQVNSPAILNAVEILQSKPGFIHPVRIVTQDHIRAYFIGMPERFSVLFVKFVHCFT